VKQHRVLVFILAIAGTALWGTVSADSLAIPHLKISGYEDAVVPAPSPQDVALLQRIAASGNPVAQYMLGWAYEKGTGTTKDTALAAKWYRKAADQDAPWAQVALSKMYEPGEIGMHFDPVWGAMKPDTKQACTFADKAAAHVGYGRGAATRGGFYLNGCPGSARDEVMAAAMYTKAVLGGYYPAADALGQFYEGPGYDVSATDPLLQGGTGVRQNLDEAIWWYSVGAQHGIGESRRHLSKLCQQQLEVPGSITQESVKICRRVTDGR
jgi:uncharacterized protein